MMEGLKMCLFSFSVIYDCNLPVNVSAELNAWENSCQGLMQVLTHDTLDV